MLRKFYGERNNEDKFEDERKNAEGYSDPTAYHAIKKVDAEIEEERYRKTIGALLRICELAGYKVEDRIVLRDRRTGKIWR